MPPPDAQPRSPAGLPPELANHPRYQVLRELGRGGMGVVYLARQTMMDRQVAIKVISKSLLDNPDALERFQREVRAAAKLVHPNIVVAYDAEQAGDLHMLVMEYVEGRSLHDILRKKGPLPVAHACHYARQAALGLQHAHEHGMVHRDIKPANLMLTRKGQVKILDFGLAKVVTENRPQQSLTAANTYMGSPEFMAPEQAQDSRSADIRADIYSLGCTLYCLLAGRPPFQGDTPLKLLLAHLDQPPWPLTALRPDVPEALWQVVARLLAKTPEERYQTPAEVVQALAPFCQNTAVAAPTPAPAVALPAQPTHRPHDTARLPAPTQPATAAPPAPRRTLWWLLGGGAAAAFLLLAVGVVVVAVLVFRARSAHATLLVELDQPDAEVSVDGQPVRARPAGDRKPLHIDVTPGKHALKVTRPGFQDFSRELTVAAGKAERVPVTLLPDVRPSAPEPIPPGEARGQWWNDGGELVQATELVDAYVLFGDPKWQDYDFEVEAMRTGGSAELAVLFRAQDGGNTFWMGCGEDNRTEHLTSLDQGRATPVVQARGAIRSERWYRLRVHVRGQHLEGFLDGRHLFNTLDDRHPRGRVGVRAEGSGIRFRNPRVTAPDGRVLWQGWPEIADAGKAGGRPPDRK